MVYTLDWEDWNYGSDIDITRHILELNQFTWTHFGQMHVFTS